MSEPTTICDTCGAPVTSDGTQTGLCPACLWGIALEPTGNVPAVAGDIPGIEILEEIARGGMGVVYRARQSQPDREVALKMLLPQAAGSPVLRERFRQEAAALAELDHPGILPVYQAGETDGTPWFTMKLAIGGTLASRLKKDGPLPPRKAAALCAHLADAAGYAHSCGILHRDIKPGNVLFGDRGETYLADFGIAHLRDGVQSLTVSAGVLGTPCYMAPEVAAKGARLATTASDVYGLGAVLYEMLAGRPPFIVEGLAAMLRKIAEDEPEHPSTVAAVPRDLESICLTCLAKSPARRYASAAELADDLRRWLDDLPITARRASVLERLQSWARRKPALAFTSGALAASLVGGGASLIRTSMELSRSNADLATSLQTARQARTAADARAELLLGDSADTMEQIGRLDLLENMWAALDETLLPDATLPEQRLHRARLDTRRGRVQALTGDTAGAVARLESALLALRGPAVFALPGAPAAASDAARTLAGVCQSRGEFEAALTHCTVAETCAVPGPEYSRLMGEAALVRAHVLELMQKAGEGTPAARAAVEHFTTWRTQSPLEDPRPLLRLIPALRQEGACLTYDKKPEEGLAAFEKSEAAARELCALKFPPEPAWQRELGESIGWKSVALRRMGAAHYPRAVETSQENLRIAQALHAEDRQNVLWQRDVASCHYGLAETYEAMGNLEEELKSRVLQHSTWSALVARSPFARDHRMNHMNACYDLGRLYVQRGTELDFAQARVLFSEMLETSWPAVQRRGASALDQERWQRDQLGNVLLFWKQAGHADEGVPFLEKAIALVTAAIPADAAYVDAALNWFRFTRSRLQRDLADLHALANRWPAAAQENQAALAGRTALYRAGWDTGNGSLPAGVVSSFKKTGAALQAQGKHLEAIANAASCLDLWSEKISAVPPRSIWADVIISTVTAAPAEGHSLAARAAAALYGQGQPPVETKPDIAAAEKLRTLAAEAPPPPP